MAIVFILNCLIKLLFVFALSQKNITSYQISKNIINQIPRELPLARIQINHLGIDNNIYDFHSPHNTVEENVQLLNGSILPNNDHSIVFLAAHSGNSKISYFERLNELKIGNKINFYYQSKHYVYEVYDYYEIKKDGDIEVEKMVDHQLVLTTCSITNSHKQLVINAKLIKKENM